MEGEFSLSIPRKVAAFELINCRRETRPTNTQSRAPRYGDLELPERAI